MPQGSDEASLCPQERGLPEDSLVLFELAGDACPDFSGMRSVEEETDDGLVWVLPRNLLEQVR